MCGEFRRRRLEEGGDGGDGGRKRKGWASGLRRGRLRWFGEAEHGGRGRYEVRSVVGTGWCGSGGLRTAQGQGSERFGVKLEDVMRVGDVRGGLGLVGEWVEGR